ncbi:M12 family metallo-peptidase [Leadbetterella sp. DM7]|uniref:M12 family metallo-peptidase n=1 Tax=Leadbetterella sp. DM7 TaxID=3235085 RepID=UPI00349E8DBF
MKRIHYIFLIFFIPFFSLNAQKRSSEKLMEVLDTPSAERLSPGQKDMFNKMKANDMYLDATLIRVGSLTELLKDGSLKVGLPGAGKEYEAKTRRQTIESETEFTWVGEFTDIEGSIMLLGDGVGNVFGHLTMGNKAYEIHDLGNEVNLLVRINDAKYTLDECATDHSKTPVELNAPKGRTMTNPYGQVRVLVLYTPAAYAAVPNIINAAMLGVAQANDALANSGVTNLDLSYAGTQPISFTETSYIDIDVGNLSTNSTVQALRNNYGADVVIMLTNSSLYGDYFGIVRNIGPSNAEAYGIVQVTAATGRYTFAHELAHLFGARHDTDPAAGYAHAHSFYTGSTHRRTVLAALPSGESRILHYSSPGINYSGVATGTSVNDNARQLSEQAATVAAFQIYGPMSASINGPLSGNNLGTYTWTSSVSNGHTPYTYNWQYSTDLVNYYPFSTASSVTAPLPFNQNLYLKLTATDVDGRYSTASFTTLNTDACSGCRVTAEGVSGEVKGLVFPNPSKGRATLYYNLRHNEEKVSLIVTDVSGKVILWKNREKLNAGRQEDDLDLSALNEGNYIVKVMGSGEIQSDRLIIVK